MSRKKPQQRVVEYYMSLHYGICHGVVEKFVSLIANEKVVTRCTGVPGLVFNVNEPELFGGIRKEGGLRGRVALQDGSADQLLDPVAAAKIGASDPTVTTPTPENLPGYRGIATAFFSEGVYNESVPSFGGVLGTFATAFLDRFGGATINSSGAGFYWAANQPFVPPLWFRVTRLDRTWLPEYAAIPGALDSSELAIVFAIDISNSMTGARLTAAKNATVRALETLRDSPNANTFDIQVVGWASSRSDITRRNCTPTDYADLIAFTEALEVEGGTVFSNAVSGLDAFYASAGDKCRYLIFLTDGQPSNPFDAGVAGDIVQASGAISFAFNLQEPDTTYTALLDTTPQDGVPIITSLDDNTLANNFIVSITQQIDTNPAHIIREAMTNSVWGLGMPEYFLDDASFAAAAATLYNENFGLSMIWTRQTTIENFVAEVLDHIQATLYVDPRIGRWVLKLIRDDYDPDTLLLFTPENCTVQEFKRRSPAETTGEIVVSWKNPATEEDETVTAQSLGTIVAAGGEIVSDTRNYYGVRRADLAAQLAARDLAASTAPLATAEIVADRTAWAVVPGQVIKLRSPEHADYDVLMRVVKVNYGRPRSSAVRLSCTEDVFAYTRPRVQTPPGSAGGDQSQQPSPPASAEVLNLNYYFANGLIDDTPTTGEAPVGFVTTSTQTDASEVEISEEVVGATGGVAYDSIGTYSVAGRQVLAAPLAADPTTTGMTLASATGLSPGVGTLVLIGPTGLTDATHEIALITERATDGTYTMIRGLLDTVPQEWPIGTLLRFISAADNIARPDLVVEGVANEYVFQIRTSLGLLAPDVAPVVAHTPTERYFAPTRPANVVVQGETLGPVDLRGFSGTINVTWANRNRISEDTVILEWTDGNVTPEVGQTTTVRLLDDETGALITEYTGLTGTSHSFPSSARGSADFVRVLVLAVRDGIESIQSREILLYFDLLDPETVAGASWLDVNDLGSLWQNANGTTPVTADLDPVGLIENQRSSFL